MDVSGRVSSMVRGWLRASPAAQSVKLPTTSLLPPTPRPERLGLGATLPRDSEETAKRKAVASRIERKITGRKRRHPRLENQEEDVSACKRTATHNKGDSSDEECSRSAAVGQRRQLARGELQGRSSSHKRKRRRKKKEVLDAVTLASSGLHVPEANSKDSTQMDRSSSSFEGSNCSAKNTKLEEQCVSENYSSFEGNSGAILQGEQPRRTKVVQALLGGSQTRTVKRRKITKDGTCSLLCQPERSTTTFCSSEDQITEPLLWNKSPKLDPKSDLEHLRKSQKEIKMRLETAGSEQKHKRTKTSSLKHSVNATSSAELPVSSGITETSSCSEEQTPASRDNIATPTARVTMVNKSRRQKRVCNKRRAKQLVHIKMQQRKKKICRPALAVHLKRHGH